MDDTKLISFLAKALIEKFPKKYGYKNKKQKYSAKEVVENLIYISRTGTSFKDVPKNMSVSNLHKHSQFLRSKKFFIETYVNMLSEYLKIEAVQKLKYQSIDTTFINNKNGFTKHQKRNKFNKGKYCLKVSYIVDAKGIPISVVIKEGSVHDSKFFDDHLKNMLIEPKFCLIKKYVNCRPYLLADSAYDGKKLRETYEEQGYLPIIPYNNRNKKNPKNMKYLTEGEKLIYKKRIIVENSFCWTKKNRRLREINERSPPAYESFLFLSLTKLIFKRIEAEKEKIKDKKKLQKK